MSTPPPPAAAAAFPRFDVVSGVPSDNSFLSTTKAPTSIPPAASKSIYHEWKILQNHLPDSISVRVYENRIDILRAVIVGAAGTPYYDGLYFFDIAFPTDYPQSPPEVTYRSFGLRINPNLYENGKVCLSLINTWPGRNQGENWNPGQSTILQVLVSIQGLVLNEKPYFNEPLLVPWVKNERWSNSYNEHVFELCCKTMLQLMRNPPGNFQGFVGAHFKERGFWILKAIEAYANEECRVGYYGTEEGDSRGEPPSERFKGSILKLRLELSVAFGKVGAPVEDLEEKSTRLILLEKEEEEKKKKKMKKSGEMLMCLFGILFLFAIIMFIISYRISPEDFMSLENVEWNLNKSDKVF